jgi:hypothetical protein
MDAALEKTYRLRVLLGPGVAGQERAPRRWGAEDASITGG